MLTHADDYPIHQTPEPIAYSGTDRNFYDRYFFNGYDLRAAEAGADPAAQPEAVFFGAAMGVYPHLNIIDASFSVIANGVQHSLHTSRFLNMERMATRVGAIHIEVLEPLRRLRVVVEENESGLRADLTFTGRIPALEEPRFTFRNGPRTILDYTRLTQNGSYEGWIEIHGKRTEVTPERWLGTRDRSWGVRPIGAQDPQPVAPPAAPQFYWLWSPLNFDDAVVLYHVNEDAAGKPWAVHGLYHPLNGEPVVMMDARSTLHFKKGTRHAASAELQLAPRDGAAYLIRLDPRFNFYMSGLGYLNPAWGHGANKGDNAVGCEEWKLAEVNPSIPIFFHVQALCRAELTLPDGSMKSGAGILEQLILGPHARSGFKGLVDGAG